MIGHINQWNSLDMNEWFNVWPIELAAFDVPWCTGPGATIFKRWSSEKALLALSGVLSTGHPGRWSMRKGRCRSQPKEKKTSQLQSAHKQWLSFLGISWISRIVRKFLGQAYQYHCGCEAIGQGSARCSERVGIPKQVSAKEGQPQIPRWTRSPSTGSASLAVRIGMTSTSSIWMVRWNSVFIYT